MTPGLGRLDALRATAQQLLGENAWPLRLHPRQKRPIGKGWGNTRASVEDFLEHDNIGLKVGESSGLVDIDLDCPEALALADRFLPRTDREHGRAATPRSHRWYRIEGETPCEQFNDPTRIGADKAKAMLVEFRGGKAIEQHQTMIPPSIHPDTGETLTWNARGAAATIPALDLLKATRRLASAALLARHWPGARHHASLAMCGALARARWTENEITTFVTAIASLVNSDDGEPGKRRAQASDSIKAIANGEHVTGIPTLISLGAPEKAIGKIRDWLELPAFAMGDNPPDEDLHDEDLSDEERAAYEAEAGTDSAQPRKKASKGEGYVEFANRYVNKHAMSGDGPLLRRWRGVWYRWFADRGCYVEQSDEQMKAELYRKLDLGTRKDVSEVLDALIAVNDVLIDHAALGDWLGDGKPPHPAHEIAACRNGLLHLPSEKLTPASPRYFATSALGVACDAAALLPAQWTAFLRELWPDDDESIVLLQDWFGYSTDARHAATEDAARRRTEAKRQGDDRPRSDGAARRAQRHHADTRIVERGIRDAVVDRQVGRDHRRRTAWRDGRDIAQVVERLLSISGEDGQTIPRKFREDWQGKLTTRIAVLTNEPPSFRDASDALPGRFLALQLARSWFGNEDPNLSSRLTSELGGILRWSIAGWRRLQQRGRFVQPSSSAAMIDEIEDLGSPVKAWSRERFRTDERDPQWWTTCADAYADFKTWCEQQGHRNAPTQTTFGRDVKTSLGCDRKLVTRASERVACYVGLARRTV